MKKISAIDPTNGTNDHQLADSCAVLIVAHCRSWRNGGSLLVLALVLVLLLVLVSVARDGAWFESIDAMLTMLVANEHRFAEHEHNPF